MTGVRKSRVGTSKEGYNAKYMRKSGFPKLTTYFSSEGRNFMNQHGKMYSNLQKNAPTVESLKAGDPHKFTVGEYHNRRAALDKWSENYGKKK